MCSIMYNNMNTIKKMYFIERKLNGATVDQMLLKWNKCETKHNKQKNCSTDNALRFSSTKHKYCTSICLNSFT